MGEGSLMEESKLFMDLVPVRADRSDDLVETREILLPKYKIYFSVKDESSPAAREG